jgi:hypothetical protein
MSWHDSVIDVGLCVLLFLAVFSWAFYTMFFGAENYKHLVIKVVMITVAIALIGESIKHAAEMQYCIAGMYNVYALFLILAALFVL